MKLNYTLLLLLITITLGYSQQTVGVFVNDSTAFNGYTLIAPFNSNQTYLIDNCGLIVNEWNESAYWTGASVYLLEDGSLMRTCRLTNGAFVTGGSGGRLEQYDWDDNLIWSYNISDSTQQQHHDIEVLPNGNILVLSFDFRTNAEALAAGRDATLLNTSLWSEKIVELQPVGIDSAVIVWEWYLWDHLVQEYDPLADNFGSVEQSPELIHFNYAGIGGSSKDWIHANAIDYNPTLDQIMLSARNYNELWVIDHSTTTAEAASHTGGNSGKGGDILYRWGNPAAYNSAQEQTFYGQHDAHWIPNGLRDAGKIMVYNNGLNFSGLISRVQIIDPPVDQNGNYTYQPNEGYLPDAPFWSYETPVYSDFISGAQRLENGNTLICDGAAGALIEIDSLENLVWKYTSPAGLNGTIITQGNYPGNNSLFRAYKYSPFYPAFTGRNLTPTVPIELNPISTDCVIYFPTDTDESWQTLDIKVVQNPIDDVLRIENLTHQKIQVKVVDVLGRIILEDNSNQSILEYDASNWAKGVYFIVAISEDNKALYRQQIIKL